MRLSRRRRKGHSIDYCVYWFVQCPLPNDGKVLANLASVTKTKWVRRYRLALNHNVSVSSLPAIPAILIFGVVLKMRSISLYLKQSGIKIKNSRIISASHSSRSKGKE